MSTGGWLIYNFECIFRYIKDRIKFFIMTTLWFDKIFNFSVQMYESFDLKKDTYILFKTYGFAIRDNFCKAFAKIVPIQKNYIVS